MQAKPHVQMCNSFLMVRSIHWIIHTYMYIVYAKYPSHGILGSMYMAQIHERFPFLSSHSIEIDCKTHNSHWVESEKLGYCLVATTHFDRFMIRLYMDCGSPYDDVLPQIFLHGNIFHLEQSQLSSEIFRRKKFENLIWFFSFDVLVLHLFFIYSFASTISLVRSNNLDLLHVWDLNGVIFVPLYILCEYLEYDHVAYGAIIRFQNNRLMSLKIW